MDLAYDHIQEQSLPSEEGSKSADGSSSGPQSSLNADLQDAYRAISKSTWGTSIGGFFGSVVKQGETVYREAQQELTAVSTEASKGLNDLTSAVISRTRGISLTSPTAPSFSKDGTGSGAGEDALKSAAASTEAESVLSRLRAEAAKRLVDVKKAEDAADEALLRFGTNIRDFLRDAVTIAPPSSSEETQSGTVLFESKDAHGKRVIHTSRVDAQLHLIHTSADSFTEDPSTSEFTTWSEGFNVEEKTEEVAKDLAQYPELRSTMEKLVPNQVAYAEFWKRYYFLRNGVDEAETRRKDLLKAASTEEEVGWDDDSEDETAPNKAAKAEAEPVLRPGSAQSSTTLHPALSEPSKATVPSISVDNVETRRSNDERSQPDSDTSYDVVGAASGVPSQAATSPKQTRKAEDSEEEDWE